MDKMKYNPLTGNFDYIGEGSGKNYDAEIAELQAEVFPLSCKLLSSSPGIIEHVDENTVLSLKWACSRKGYGKIPSYVKITQDGNVIFESSSLEESSSIIDGVQVSKLGVTNFILTVEADGQTATSMVSVERILPLFIGFDEQKDYLNLVPLGKDVKKSWNGEKLNLKNPFDGGYLVIAIPEGKTIKSITSNGFTVPMDSPRRQTGLKIKGVGYYYSLYTSANPISAGIMSNLVITI